MVGVAMVAPPPTAQIGTKGTRGLTHTLCTTPATHTASTGSTLSLNLNRIMVLISSCDCSARHRLSPHLQLDTTYDSLKIFTGTVLEQGVGKGGGPFGINKNKCVFNKRKIKVGVSCSRQCPGTSTPSSTLRGKDEGH